MSLFGRIPPSLSAVTMGGGVDPNDPGHTSHQGVYFMFFPYLEKKDPKIDLRIFQLGWLIV